MTATDALAQQITALQEEMIPQIPPEALNAMMAATKKLAESGLAEKALKAGDRCPDFELANASGTNIRLSEQLKSGPQILSFYRGAWCPYCNLEIKALRDNLDAFRQHGADLIAISPQIPEMSLGQISELGLDFEVLSDIGNQVAKQFGLVFSLGKDIQDIYTAFEIDVAAHNGNNLFELPIPATYIVGNDRSIRYAFIDADYTKRMEPEAIINALQKL